MARILTCGFEAQQLASGSPDPISLNIGGTITTSVVRSGSAAYQLAPGFTAFNLANAVGVAGQTLYLRYYFRKSANAVANTLSQHNVTSGSTGSFSVDIATDQTLKIKGGTGSSVALNDNQWYRIELSVTNQSSGSGTITLYVDGVSSSTYTWTYTTLAVNNGMNLVGPGPSDPGTFYFDDIAINDSTGSYNNGLCGDGKVLLLKPASDKARNAWVRGTTQTTDLWDAVNNVPPAGKSATDAGNTNAAAIEIRNNSTTGDGLSGYGYYHTYLQTLQDVGISSADTVNALTYCAQVGNSSSTSRSISITGFTPDSSTTTVATSGAAGNTPTNWSRGVAHIGSTTNPNGISRTTASEIFLQKLSSTTDYALCDFLGAMVDYTPAVTTVMPSKPIVASQAVTSAATR